MIGLIKKGNLALIGLMGIVMLAAGISLNVRSDGRKGYFDRADENLWRVCFYNPDDLLDQFNKPVSFTGIGAGPYHQSMRAAKSYLAIFGAARNQKATSVVIKVISAPTCGPTPEENTGERVIILTYIPGQPDYSIWDSREAMKEILKEDGDGTTTRFSGDRKGNKKE